MVPSRERMQPAKEQQCECQRKFRKALRARTDHAKVAQKRNTGIHAPQDQHPSSLIVKKELSHRLAPKSQGEHSAAAIRSAGRWPGSFLILHSAFCILHSLGVRRRTAGAPAYAATGCPCAMSCRNTKGRMPPAW